MDIKKYVGKFNLTVFKNIYFKYGVTKWGYTTVWFGAKPYSYSGVKHTAKVMPTYFGNMADSLGKSYGYSKGYFNSVLINYFPRGKGIGFHRDDEEALRLKDGTIGAILVLTLGTPAEITIRGDKVNENFTAHDSTTYLMPEGDFQDTHEHKVGKTKTYRISLTFRHIEG